jgi:thiol-disulfide isomerase/thioredoxin
MDGCRDAAAIGAGGPTPLTSRGRRAAGASSALAVALALVGSAAFGESGEPLAAAFERIEGGKLHLADLRGGPVLLELWATWCAPCKQQAIILEDLRAELEERGVTVLAVDIGEKPKVVREYLAEHPKSYPVLLDRPQVLPRLLDINELPVLALLDRQGKVAATHLGLAQPDEVRGLLGGLASSSTAD